jgi:hypothetical protein
LCELSGGKKRTGRIILSGAIAPVLNQPDTIQCVVHFIFSFRSSDNKNVASGLSPSLLSNEGTVLAMRLIIAHQPVKKDGTFFF